MKHHLGNGLKENPQNIQEHDTPKWDHLSLRDKAPACFHDYQSISLYEHSLLAYDKVPRSNEKPNDSLLLLISKQYKTNQKAGNEKTQNEKVIKYIDYDLDLRVFPNGSFKILDRMEYRYHKKQMHYSSRLDFILKYELGNLIDMVRTKEAPFNKKTIEMYHQKYVELVENNKK